MIPDVPPSIPGCCEYRETRLSLEICVDGTMDMPTSIIHQDIASTSIDELAITEYNPKNRTSMITAVCDDVSATSETTQRTSLGQDSHEQETPSRTGRGSPKERISSIQPEHSLQERSRCRIIASLMDKNNCQQSGSKSTRFAADEPNQRLSQASVVDPSLLGPKQCSAIVVNYISAGYILLPFGKSQR